MMDATSIFQLAVCALGGFTVGLYVCTKFSKPVARPSGPSADIKVVVWFTDVVFKSLKNLMFN